MELVCRRGCLQPPQADILKGYAEALAVYRKSDFRRAAGMFGEMAADPPSRMMARRSAEMARGEIEPHEDGIFVLRSK
jgi:hypothetical protein